jgi:hypothetical protein
MSGRHWTPYDIEVVLHHFASGARFDRWTAPAYEPCVSALVEAGILTVADVPDSGVVSGINCTPLGEALVEMWLQTPAPRMVALDPRNGKEVMTERGLSAGSFLTVADYLHERAVDGLAQGGGTL